MTASDGPGDATANPGCPTDRLGLTAEAVAVVLTAVVVVGTVALAAPGELAAAVVVALALASGCAGAVADLLGTHRRPAAGSNADATASAPDGTASAPDATVTVVVRLGDEPVAVARAAVAAATEAGPVAVVSTTARPVLTGLPAGVRVHRAEDLGAATCAAVGASRTTGVLVVSARAFVDAAAVRRAAHHLAGGAAWVSGASVRLNRDRFGSDHREEVDARLRRRTVGAGLWCWEPDATLVRTELLGRHPLPADRPLGSWLRARAAEGARGVATDEVLSRRAAPVAAGRYWPDTVARQRAAAADLGDAAVAGGVPIRARLAALALLGRALFGWPALLWLALPVVLAGGVPVTLAAGPAVGIVAALFVLRWWALRQSLGVAPEWRSDLVAAIYAAPGSLAATGAAVTRRVGPPRLPVPTRPLVWAGLIAALVAARGILVAEPGSPGARVAIAASLVLLGVTWAFGIRALVERGWSRDGFRVRLDRSARLAVDGVELPVRVRDGGPGGLAVDPGAADPPERGSEVTVVVALDDGATVRGPGVVAGVRPDCGVVGLEFRPAGADLRRWAAELVRAAGDRPDGARTTTGDAAPARVGAADWADRLLVGAVVATSVVVAAALALVLLGFQPLVVRSPSMVPTYDVGDVVLAEVVPAESLRPGQVASRLEAAGSGNDITHRVRSVDVADGVVTVVTQGDANASSERWAVPVGSKVGRVVASVPWIGTPLTAVRASAGAAAAALVGVAVVVALLLRRRRGAPGGAPGLATGDEDEAAAAAVDDAGGGPGDAADSGQRSALR